MYTRLAVLFAVSCALIAIVNADPYKRRYDSCKNSVTTLLNKPTGQSKCNLITGLSKISVNASLTASENTTYQAWITNMETTIINNSSISNQTKLTMCAGEIKKFQDTNVTIYGKIQWINITTVWGGSVDTFVRITNEYNFAPSMEMVVASDTKGNCKLFDALLSACKGDSAKTAALKAFMESDLKDIVKNKGKKSQPDIMISLKKAFKKFFAMSGQSSWMNDFMGYKLMGYSFTFGQWTEVSATYEKKDSLNATLSGNNMTCPFITAMNATLSSSNYTTTQKGFIKSIMLYFQQQWSVTISVQARMDMISAKFSECGDLSTGYTSLIGGISIPSFGGGSFFDLIIIGGCQTNNMPTTCGCPIPTFMMMTTEMPWETSEMPSSTTKCSCSCEM